MQASRKDEEESFVTEEGDLPILPILGKVAAASTVVAAQSEHRWSEEGRLSQSLHQDAA